MGFLDGRVCTPASCSAKEIIPLERENVYQFVKKTTTTTGQTQGRRERKRKGKEEDEKERGRERGKGKLEVKLWQKRKKSQTPQPGIEPGTPANAADALPLSHRDKRHHQLVCSKFSKISVSAKASLPISLSLFPFLFLSHPLPFLSSSSPFDLAFAH